MWDQKARCSNPDDPGTCTSVPNPLLGPQEFDLYYSEVDAGVSSWLSRPADGHLDKSISSFRSLAYPLKYNQPWCQDESPSTCTQVVP